MKLFKDIDLKNPKTIFALACLALMVVIVLVQFWPGVWTFDEYDQITGETTEETASIMELVWFPKSNNGAYAEFFDGKTVGLVNIPVTRNQVALAPAGQLLFAAFAFVFITKYPKATLAGIFVVVCGILGLYGYLLIEGFRVHFIWYINIILSALAVVAGFVYIFSNKVFKSAE